MIYIYQEPNGYRREFRYRGGARRHGILRAAKRGRNLYGYERLSAYRDRFVRFVARLDGQIFAEIWAEERR